MTAFWATSSNTRWIKIDGWLSLLLDTCYLSLGAFFLRSDLPGFAFFDQAVEIREERVGVVRAGGGFGVVLD